jgi:serine O-acetyltransferase
MRQDLRSFLEQVREDYHAHGRDWTKPGFRSVAVHRFGVWRMTIRSKLLRAPFSVAYRIMFRYCRNIYGIEVPYSVRLGHRVIIEHQGGIVIHGASAIGDDCIIRQNCTIGIRDLKNLDAAPTLEDGVSLGAGSIVLGSVTLGNGCIVGANAVVLVDVPPGALAVGVPARIVERTLHGGASCPTPI